jgi:hypothetical protein
LGTPVATEQKAWGVRVMERSMQPYQANPNQEPDPTAGPGSPRDVPPLPVEEPPLSRPDLADPKPELEPDREPESPVDSPVAPPVLPGH